jgi:hypothetical protein
MLLIVVLGYFYQPVSIKEATEMLSWILWSIAAIILLLAGLVIMTAWIMPRFSAWYRKSHKETETPEQKPAKTPKEVTPKGGGVVSTMSILFLWVTFVMVVALGNHKAWSMWTRDLGYFAATQIVAIALIAFAAKNGWQKFAGGVIALMLALSLLYTPGREVPQQISASAKEIGQAQTRTREKVETYIVVRDKWTMVRIPDHHYFYFDCAGKVAVDILDNHIPITECDNRAKPITVGNNIKPTRSGSSGAFALRAVGEDLCVSPPSSSNDEG